MTLYPLSRPPSSKVSITATVFTSLLLLFGWFPVCAQVRRTSQKEIQLTNKQTHRSVYLAEGLRVRCLLSDGTRGVGILTHITDSTICLNDVTIALKDIHSIGRRKKNSMLYGCLLITGGMLFTVADISLIPGESRREQIWDIERGGVFAIITFAGIHTLSRNSIKNVSRKWRLTVISSDD